MQQSQVRRVLVVEGSRLVGIISTADLARASARKEGRLGEEVETVMEKVSADNGRSPGLTRPLLDFRAARVI